MSSPSDETPSAGTRAPARGFKAATLFGIEIRLDVTVVIIFGLVVWSLATGAFPRWHPEWGAGTAWGVALAAGVLFFVSLLLHELAHSVVAKAFGIPVPRITLFLFGGVSELQREPQSPGVEFLVAVVGPLMSLLLGVVFLLAGLGLAGAGFTDLLSSDPEAALASLGAAETVLLWLGPLNLLLAAFNMIPGFPLDGGRVLRSILWALTKDLTRATRWASLAGRGFGWGLIALGALQAFAGALVGGLWLVLIGWFLQRAAATAYAQLLVRQAMEHLSVRDLMRTRFDAVDPELTLDRFIDEVLIHTDQTTWPVEQAGRALGLVTYADVVHVPERERPWRRVRDVMHALDGEAVSPDAGGQEALEHMVRSGRDPLPVTDGDRVVGLLHRNDVMRWLAVHRGDLDSRQAPPDRSS